MELLFAPFRAFVSLPVLAFIPALVLLAAGLIPASRAPRFVLWTGVAWLAYAIYETSILMVGKARGEAADIRVDLLVIAPLLELLTLVAIVLWIRAAMTAGQPGG